MSSAWGNVFATAPSRNVYAVDTFTDLRNLTPPSSSVSIEVDGGITVGDGIGGIFFFSLSSTLADDGLNVITPASAPANGRWIRRDQVGGYNTFRKNAIINGRMEICQRNNNVVSPGDGIFIADRFKYRKNGTMTHTVSQDLDVPTASQFGSVLVNSLLYNLTLAQAVIGAGDYNFIHQVVEGYNWSGLAQRPITLSFWIKATLPGIYSACLLAGTNYSYVSDFTINNANTWEKKVINAPASPAASNNSYVGGIGVQVIINIVGGVNFQVTPTQLNTWALTGNFCSPNQINGVQAANVNFRVTAIQLEAGSIASEFERRTIQEELILCQRYYEKTFNQGVAVAQNLGLSSGEVIFRAIQNGNNANSLFQKFAVIKRTTPNIILYNPAALNAQVRDETGAFDCSGSTGVDPRHSHFLINCTQNVGTATGNLLGVHWTAEAEL